MRAVAGQLATVRCQFATDDGAALTLATAPSVTITAGDGSVVSGAQQGTPDPSLGDGAYKVQMLTPPKLDTLTATWTATVDGFTVTQPGEIKVVGQRLVSPFTLRQADSNLSGLSPVSLLTLLDQVEELVTNVLRYSPVLEGTRATFDTIRGTLTESLYSSGTVNGLPYGYGGGRCLIPGVRMPCTRPPGGVYAGTINGDPMTVSDLAALTDIDGALAWTDYRPWISGRYSLWLAHGDPNPPQDLRNCAQRLCTYYGKTSAYPERTSQVSSEGATIFFALPSADRPTGIPEVDGILNRKSLESVI